MLTSQRMQNLVGVVRGQRFKEEIGCPCYLIEGTAQGTVRPCQEPQKALPLREVMFLNSNNDIQSCLLANHGQDHGHLLVVASGARIERTERINPSLPRADSRFSVTTFGRISWGLCRPMRITMRMSQRRNGKRPRVLENGRRLFTGGRGLWTR